MKPTLYWPRRPPTNVAVTEKIKEKRALCFVMPDSDTLDLLATSRPPRKVYVVSKIMYSGIENVSVLIEEMRLNS